ncbi:hypothetical protein IB277_20410 [Ensifer sp. ENS07]|uniref:hypothetical protein n=1 Tax=Ensifer sp. ENS07 TaxID=2769274 RepID=UPI000DDE5674|nr:hypothetical protein [Ensifer sp. ENS07]MBD9638668.1 hypothetical protein [Ensifer sp. ENS07]
MILDTLDELGISDDTIVVFLVTTAQKNWNLDAATPATLTALTSPERRLIEALASAPKQPA